MNLTNSPPENKNMNNCSRAPKFTESEYLHDVFLGWLRRVGKKDQKGPLSRQSNLNHILLSVDYNWGSKYVHFYKHTAYRNSFSTYAELLWAILQILFLSQCGKPTMFAFHAFLMTRSLEWMNSTHELNFTFPTSTPPITPSFEMSYPCDFWKEKFDHSIPPFRIIFLWFLKLLENYANGDNDAKEVLGMFDLHIIPSLNGDGYVFSWTDVSQLKLPGPISL